MASSAHLKPGEQGKINVSLSLAGKSGPMVKHVQVQTNDPKKLSTTLTVRVNVKAPAQASSQPPAPK